MSVAVSEPSQRTGTGALVLLRGLTKAFGSTVAVDRVDLTVVPGEVVGFLGPNGAGKTTVLRVLTGMLRATAGSVTVLGRDPFLEAARVHQDLGYLPGDLRLPPHLTGAQVLDLCAAGRRDAGVDRADLVARLDVPLTVEVQAMSKGNRQKLGIVQALMSRPRVLLLDEPTSGLDPFAQEVLEQLVRESAAGGASVLLSSHVLREVEQVASRVVMLRRGQVVASTSLAALRSAAPYDVEVALDDAGARSRLAALPGLRDVVTTGRRVSCKVPTEGLPALLSALAAEHVRDVRIEPADLESLFLHFYEGV